MSLRQWLAKLLGVNGSARQRRIESERARMQLAAAIERLNRELRDERHH